jgi:hypothetical protein
VSGARRRRPEPHEDECRAHRVLLQEDTPV